MARQVLPIVGYAVGSYFGYPQLGALVGALVASAIPEERSAPSLGDLPVQTSQEGQPRAIVYGTATCTGYIIDFGPPLATTEFVDSGGGKGSSDSTPQSVVYRNYAIAICEGPIQALLRVWANDKVVYDIRPDSLMLAESEAWIANKNIFLGGEDQVPSVFLQLNGSGGLANTPAYRGTAYMVVGLENLTDSRGAIPQYRFEVAGTASLSLTLRPLIVYPWVQNSIDPRDSRNEHTYLYKGYTYQPGAPQNFPQTGVGTLTADLGVALNEAVSNWNASTTTPPGVGALNLIGNGVQVGTNDTNTMFPPYGNVAAQQQELLLHYNEIAPNSYVAPGSWPLADASLPTYPATAWGAQNPIGAVWYWAPTFSHGAQWTSPGRRFATETWTNQFSDINEKFYTYDAIIAVRRTPVPPFGFTKITGTAKQLAAIEYRSGTLYQNGVGPVLLPDDPDYSNATFWADARTAAITAGTLHSDVSSPVVVSAYATGYITALGEPIPLTGIVADCCDRAGLAADRFDVSDLDGISVDGLTLQGNYDAGSAIDVLRGCYFFDRCEPGENLVFVRRGAAVVETITIDDLVEVPDLSKREQVSEVPRKLHLMYQTAVAGYAPVKADSEIRSADMLSVSERTVQVPVVLNDPNAAAQMVVKMHDVISADSQGEIKLVLPISKLARVPSNCIGLSLRGQVRRLRIDQTELDFLSGRYSLTLRVDRQSAYTSNVTGIPIPPSTLPPSTIAGATQLAVMDISARVDSEDDLNVLVAGTGALPGWHGWTYQRSLDGGANYTTVDTYSRAAVMGVLLDDVAAASEHFTDTTNVVRLQLYRSGQVLEDITEQQFLSEDGAFVLMDAEGVCEVLQYRDSDAEGDGIFALSVLHRGRLNSGARAHTAGEKFILLRDAQHVVAQSAWIGQDLTNRAVSVGTSPETGTVQTIAYAGTSQSEWPVASFVLTRSGDNVTGTWVPRHRFGTDDAPVASINLRGFRVTIVGTGTITFDTTAQTFTQDVSSIGGAVTVSVSALNRITGAGPSTAGSI